MLQEQKQEQETIPALIRRTDDPPLTDFTSKRRSLETLWRDKFETLAEQNQQINSSLARFGAQFDIAKIEVQAKMASLSKEIQEINERLQAEAENQESERINKELIRELKDQLTQAQELNRIANHSDIKYTVTMIVVIILAIVILLHLAV